MNKLFFISLFLVCNLFSFAQTKVSKTTPKTTQATTKKLVQLSGIVVEGDSLKPVAFSAVVVKNTTRGTITDGNGFFTLVVEPGQVLQFVTLGYKDAFYTMADTITVNNFSIVQVLRPDTILLKTVVVKAYMSKEELKHAFLNFDVPRTDLDNAEKNLAAEEMRELVKGISTDAQGNYRYAMQQKYSQMVYRGAAPNQLLNPFAWVKFVKALKAGKLKIQ